MVEKIKQIINTKTLFIALSILFAIPSIIYLIQNKSIVNFESSYQFLLTNSISRIDHTIIFFILFICITILYFGIIKKHIPIIPGITSEIIIFIIDFLFNIFPFSFLLYIIITSNSIIYITGANKLYVNNKPAFSKNNSVILLFSYSLNIKIMQSISSIPREK